MRSHSTPCVHTTGGHHCDSPSLQSNCFFSTPPPINVIIRNKFVVWQHSASLFPQGITTLTSLVVCSLRANPTNNSDNQNIRNRAHKYLLSGTSQQRISKRQRRCCSLFLHSLDTLPNTHAQLNFVHSFSLFYLVFLCSNYLFLKVVPFMFHCFCFFFISTLLSTSFYHHGVSSFFGFLKKKKKGGENCATTTTTTTKAFSNYPSFSFKN